MLRTLRITLMWLIALAVPVQGFAAVTMFGCGPGQHGGIVSTRMVMADEHALSMPRHGDQPTGDAGGHHHHDDSAAPHDHAGSHSAHGTAHKVVKGNCAPCASCCVAAALPATVIQFDPVQLVDFFVPSAQSGVSSFLPEGLERPPRLILA